MKTRTILALGVVVVLAAYAGATYHHASKAEAAALDWSQRLAKSSPLLKVAGSDYQRGFLRSTQNIAIELGPNPFVGGKTPTVTLRNVIYHGPLPGFANLGIARIDHSLVFDEATAKELAKAFGDAPPITAVTTLSLSGEGTTRFTGAPATYKSGEDAISWQGLTGTLRFTRDLASYAADFTAPGLVASGKDGGSVNVRAVSLKMDQARMAGTENLYLGTMSMGVEALSTVKDGKPQAEVKNVSMNSNVSSRTPEFLDMIGRLAAAEVRSAAFSATDAEYAFSFTHIHAPSLEKLGKAIQEAQDSMAKGFQGAAGPAVQAAQAAIMQAVATHGLAILQREPLFTIERIGFISKEGETRITGSARLVGVTEADLQNPLGLIAKVQAEATIKLSEAIIAGFMGDAQKLTDLVQQGYIVRESGILSSKLAVREGRFTVNDKPFDPMGQGAQ